MNRMAWMVRRLWWWITPRRAVRLGVRSYRRQAPTPTVPLPEVGSQVVVSVERLGGQLLLTPGGQNPVIRECWIDTGAYLTIFPEAVWRLVAADINWLNAPGSGPFPPWLTAARIAGGPFPCRPGLIALQIIDDEGRSLPEEPIVALFPQDGGRLKTILLGLEGLAFVRKHLELDYDDREGWLLLR